MFTVLVNTDFHILHNTQNIERMAHHQLIYWLMIEKHKSHLMFQLNTQNEEKDSN